MNDCELLEMAAKAAGYIIESHTEDGAWVYIDGSLLNDDGENSIFLWRPRVNDGDALRLAVKLNLSIHQHQHGAGWVDVGVFKNLTGGDPYSATRRAIVRAAAEIGKSAG